MNYNLIESINVIFVEFESHRFRQIIFKYKLKLISNQ